MSTPPEAPTNPELASRGDVARSDHRPSLSTDARKLRGNAGSFPRDHRVKVAQNDDDPASFRRRVRSFQGCHGSARVATFLDRMKCFLGLPREPDRRGLDVSLQPERVYPSWARVGINLTTLAWLPFALGLSQLRTGALSITPAGPKAPQGDRWQIAALAQRQTLAPQHC